MLPVSAAHAGAAAVSSSRQSKTGEETNTFMRQASRGLAPQAGLATHSAPSSTRGDSTPSHRSLRPGGSLTRRALSRVLPYVPTGASADASQRSEASASPGIRKSSALEARPTDEQLSTLPRHVAALYIGQDRAIAKLQSAFRGHRHRLAHLNVSRSLHLAYELHITVARLTRRRFAYGLFFHLIYVILLCTVVMFQRGSGVTDRAEFESSMQSYLSGLATPQTKITLGNTNSVAMFWSWTQEAFLPALTAERSRGQSRIATYNLLVGNPRLEVVRVTSDSCPWRTMEFSRLLRIQNTPSECFGERVPGNEDVAPFGPWSDPTKYTSRRQHGESRFTADLNNDSAFTTKIVDELILDDFASKNTRRLSLSLLAYNHASVLFCFVRVYLDITAAGRGTVSFFTEAISAQEYFHSWATFQLMLEVVLAAWTVVHALQEVRQFAQERRRFGRVGAYVGSFFNWLDWGRIASVLGLLGTWMMIATDDSRSIDLQVNDYVDLEGPTQLYRVYDVVVCFALLLSLTSLLQYFELSEKLAAITRALAHASADLPYFMCLFMLFYLGFAFVGHLRFGPSLYGTWGRFDKALYTCVELMIGNYQFSELEATASGPDDVLAYVSIAVYYYLFIFLMYFLMVNMLLAILMDGYMKVKEAASSASARDTSFNLGPLGADLWNATLNSWASATVHVCARLGIAAPKQALDRPWSETKWQSSLTVVQEMRRERGLSIKTMTIAELVKWLRTLPENKKEDVLKQVLARFHHRRFRDVGATFGAKEEDPSEAARRLNAEVRQMRKDMRELTVMMVKIATVLPDGTANHYVVAPSTSDQPDPVPKEKKPLPGIASADPSGVPFEIERRASGEG